ncbi:MAG: DUF192 domain-containing protein [Myxococcales bacterium]|nr:DUF192 domain-containing protein [Myxococcales bacterium]
MVGCRAERHRTQLIDPEAPVRVAIHTVSGEAIVTVEVADTKPVINKGLMDRRDLGAERGMLFFMGKERDWSFWMHDTLIPLDMIFITTDLTVAGVVHDAQPQTETSRKVGAISLYVLEVNAGWSAAHGVETGARVRFENIKP